MPVPLHQTLTLSCRDLLTRVTDQRTAEPAVVTQCPILPITPEHELQSQLLSIWTDSITESNQHREGDTSADNLKGHLEIVGRELIVGTAEEEISQDVTHVSVKWRFIAKLYDACDIVRILFNVASTNIPLPDNPSTSASVSAPKWDPIVMLMSIIDELVELLSIDSWNLFFGYLESRQDALTKGELLSKIKALYFLKPLNNLLRITSRSSHAHPSTTFATFNDFLESIMNPPTTTDGAVSGSTSELELRGRIHLFMSGLFKISDPSATNSRGDYADMLLDYDLIDDTIEPVDDDENLEKEQDGIAQVSENTAETGREKGKYNGFDDTPLSPDLYETIRSLNRFFSSPVAITLPSSDNSNETGLQEFKRRTESLMAAFNAYDPKSSSNYLSTSDTFEPRYIPSKDSIEYQLNDISFRRQIYIQLLVILQQIQNLHVKDKARHPKDMHFPTTFGTETDDYEWARNQVTTVHMEIAKMPDGRQFDSLVSTILARERNHAIWKHAGCYPFERDPMREDEIAKAESRRRGIIAPLPPFTHSAGTKALSQLGRNALTSVEQLRKHRVTETVESLQTKWNEVDFDEGMGGNPREFLEQKASLSWRTLRLVLEQDFDLMEKLKDRYDPNSVIQIKQQALEQSNESSQLHGSNMGTPNMPSTATLAADSETDDKDLKPEDDKDVKPEDATVSVPFSQTDASMEPASMVAAVPELATVGDTSMDVSQKAAVKDDASDPQEVQETQDIEMK
ncbi:hypothetical protein QFC22_004097 [Naganishia vaughanmartiniae]|uniref:Uncharacterized protein n=1 Tax=Naganishia vaughanmartiniae TaxID=1424756 RepID=A0ACC2X2E0_9TREE|nr:hypothetical protein QFC22_004097 [Naganishia vaughanmartiniae]